MGDVVAPAYTETDESDLLPWVQQVAARAEELGLPLTRLQERVMARDIQRLEKSTASAGSPLEKAATKQTIVTNFFRLVRAGQTASVALFVQSGLVSPDVLERGTEDVFTDSWVRDHPCEPDDPGSGTTPLLAAVDVGNAAMVRMLVSLGADMDLLARPPFRKGQRPKESRHGSLRKLNIVKERCCRRTPLMLAAADGRLALVRLLLTEMGANDGIVAPDGQLALRLAADAGHRDIVALLPSRRGGAWRRFRANNARAMHRASLAARGICHGTAVVCRLVGWELPRFIIVKVFFRCLKYTWHHRCEALAALLRLPQGLWKFVRNLGTAAVDLTRALATAIRLVITRIPAALRIAAAWIVQSAGRIGHAIADAMLYVVAALHTAATAVVVALARLRTVTVQDVWNGFCVAARAAFVDIPVALADVVLSLGTNVCAVVKTLFGFFGSALVILAEVLLHILAFIPIRLGRILSALGSVFGVGYHEVCVWINPKYSA